MSTTPNRETAAREGHSLDNRLARLLETPFLAQVVPHLAPETLHQLIQYRGLDACGELVTSATPAQLTSLLDLDLWHHAQPGRDDLFDVDRFGEWLEVLVETGESVAARTVAALDSNVVVAGLSRYVRVFDPGIFEPTAQSDDETIDHREAMHEGDALDVDATKPDMTGASIECEVGGYLLRARRTDAWDAIVALLVTLEIEHNHEFHALMQGCRALSNSRPEMSGFDDLLMDPEQHLHDLTLERERRRGRQGYATPADARAFLQMARQPRAMSASIATNPIVAAYFRAAEEDEEEADTSTESASEDATEHASHHDATDDSARGNDVPASMDAVIELLAEAGMMPGRPRALLEAPADDPRAAWLPHLRRLMEFVRQRDETAYLTRSRELAFLANALLAGCSVQSRPFTPQEASDAAACICNLGLECWPARWPLATSHEASSPQELDTAMPPDAFLVDHDLVVSFEVGWSVLYQEVSLFVTDQLISTLDNLRRVDADIRPGLRALLRKLIREREAGTPWLARDAADVLTMLDMTAWISVLGLLDECPILPAALTAVLERRTTSVSQTSFAFISTTDQIGDVRLFIRTLPGLLSR